MVFQEQEHMMCLRSCFKTLASCFSSRQRTSSHASKCCVSAFSLFRESCLKNPCQHICSRLHCTTASYCSSGGEPYSTAGDARRYVHWYALGSSLGLANDGNHDYSAGHRVDVSLVAGQVTGWGDALPSDRPRKRSMPCARADGASCGPVC